MANKFFADDRVKVNKQDDQFGKIAEYGTIVDYLENGEYLVCVGGSIRSNIVCHYSELS